MTNRTDGWKVPTNESLQRDFFAKHGDDSYTRGIDRKWRRIGNMVDKGARIHDGYLGR